jgi:hypothetical protein
VKAVSGESERVVSGGTKSDRRSLSGFPFALTVAIAALIVSLADPRSSAASPLQAGVWGEGYGKLDFCARRPELCTDSVLLHDGKYVGHDEPALAFYSATPGSGNSLTYTFQLPTEPPALPTQNGKSGVYDFELYPAFWLGMALCDSQSYPEFTTACTPDSDANIFAGSDPNAADYIGHHPGAAFMELQFYPPGWVPSCDGSHWCAAMTIDSELSDPNHGKSNNQSCNKLVGDEPVNIAFITTSGVADAPADPLNGTKFIVEPNLTTALLMNPGDTLTVQITDTPDGVQTAINDLTQATSGSMTAGLANGFAQVVFDPKARKCTSQRYAFRPMYATSGPQTNVPWAAHTFNVGVSWELGHFELCDKVAGGRGQCKKNNEEQIDSDDIDCYSAGFSPGVQVGGCVGEDSDFDGPSYLNDWPGSIISAPEDSLIHPSATLFTSPVFQPQPSGPAQNYDSVAFEADMPLFEAGFKDGCSKLTGKGCTNPPKGAPFYPFYSIGANGGGACVWQFGAADIPGTTNDFGGSSRTEFGTQPLGLTIATTNAKGRPATVTHFDDFRTILSDNPCPAPLPQ